MKFKCWHAIAFITCVVWIVYYPALSAPLNSVDDLRLAHDLLNRSEFTWGDFWIPKSKSYFRPLVNSSFIVDSLVWGFEASFVHLENVLLHWLNTLLVYCVAMQVAQRKGLNTVAIPTIAALFFGLHPINTEAVIWVAGRADLLATTFVLVSLACAIKFYNSGVVTWCVAAVFAFFVGSLAKETSLFLLPGLFIMGWLVCKESLIMPKAFLVNKAFLPALGCLLSAVIYALLRVSVLRDSDAGVRQVSQVLSGSYSPGVRSYSEGLDFTGWLESLDIALRGAGFYACKLVQPFPLNFGIIEVPDWYFWVGCLLVFLITILLRRLTWEGSFVLIAMSLTSVALLVAMGNISWTPFAERYMYAPAAMLAISGSLVGGEWLRDKGYGAWQLSIGLGVASLLLFCAVAVFQRGIVWQDNLTLFTDTVKKSPGFALGRNQMAEALWKRGRKQEALEILRELKIPDTQVAFLNKVLILMEEGRLEEAREFLLENLNKSSTNGYHTVILERLIVVVERLSVQSTSLALRDTYNDEIVSYLEQLWRRTKKPFYLYRLGQKHLEWGNCSAAQVSFSLAYSELPDNSIYKEPARKLAESLKGKCIQSVW
ncbi:hypothetical protein P9J64_14355 [Deltaproteobacteria bacterium IMCC39524]|nr:hypothetical protein [Deltaproteobacteria bacterium IMCC39524]